MHELKMTGCVRKSMRMKRIIFSELFLFCCCLRLCVSACVCPCDSICVCVCVLMFISVYLFVQLSVSHLVLYFRLEFVSLCVRSDLCVFVFVLACVCACTCVCVCLCLRVWTCMSACQSELCNLSMSARLNKDQAVFLPSSYLAALLLEVSHNRTSCLFYCVLIR